MQQLQPMTLQNSSALVQANNMQQYNETIVTPWWQVSWKNIRLPNYLRLNLYHGALCKIISPSMFINYSVGCIHNGLRWLLKMSSK